MWKVETQKTKARGAPSWWNGVRKPPKQCQQGYRGQVAATAKQPDWPFYFAAF